MLARGEFELEADDRVRHALAVAGGRRAARRRRPDLRCMRDATRGGVASVLNELARASGVAMLVREADVPVAPAVAGAAELLGIDPMYVANEGKLRRVRRARGRRRGARRAARRCGCEARGRSAR